MVYSSKYEFYFIRNLFVLQFLHQLYAHLPFHRIWMLTRDKVQGENSTSSEIEQYFFLFFLYNGIIFIIDHYSINLVIMFLLFFHRSILPRFPFLHGRLEFLFRVAFHFSIDLYIFFHHPIQTHLRRLFYLRHKNLIK